MSHFHPISNQFPEAPVTPEPPRYELLPTSLKSLGGWGFECRAQILTNHGPAVLVAPLAAKASNHMHLPALAASDTTNALLNRIGIRWHEGEQCLEIPLGPTLQRLWDAQTLQGHDSGFRVRAVPYSRQERQDWKRSVAQGECPVAEFGEYPIHDVTDHIPCIATLDPTYSRSFQARMEFLIALQDRITTEWPPSIRKVVHQLLSFHEQQFELGTVQLSINLGHLPADPQRALQNMTKVYDRMQKWPALLELSDSKETGDMTFLVDGLRERMQREECWIRSTRSVFDEAVNASTWTDVVTRARAGSELATEQIARIKSA